jgi:predicted DNA-binding transcriptional regulator AlpA
VSLQLVGLDDLVALAVERALNEREQRPSSEPWLGAKRAAEHVDMTEHAFRKAVERGQLPRGRRWGGRRRWRASELDAVIEGGIA